MFTLHIAALAVAIVTIVLADKQAFSWIRGTRATIEPKASTALHRTMWFALIILIGTGATMAFPMREYLFAEPLYLVKMLFVAILLINAVIIGRLTPIAHTRTFTSLTREEKKPLIASGAISTFAWIATILTALALFA